jgi:hypothetical protein
MDAKEIIAALAENNLDLARSKVAQTLSEKAAESLQARKVEIASTYFDDRK